MSTQQSRALRYQRNNWTHQLLGCVRQRPQKSQTVGFEYACPVTGQTYDTVNIALKGKDAGTKSGLIFAAFAHQGWQPVHYSHRCQLLHFTCNRLSPSTIRAYLCPGAWGRCNLLVMEDLLTAVTSQKCKQSEREEGVEEYHSSILLLFTVSNEVSLIVGVTLLVSSPDVEGITAGT
ncbi:hypothetical protein SCLCIDRAFT_133089 [Scleroderma citrinum Foug A]|uniref:Uncharacterized protein n=1 Tax=Scleroderma citrinum Foug A TaxID=1036808 RepID=A0A0C2ZUN1_9AGAM|nr:hypothetical protein SCLCIDRAFT_133089 [Scleroderma citrinum Foug A]